MKKQFYSFLLLISLFLSVPAQTTKPDAAERNLRTHVAYLASDRLEGRRTGERGATFAAGYIANLFANYKLKGGYAGDAGGRRTAGFLQPFPLVASVELGKGNRLMVTLPNANQLFAAPADWTPFAASPKAELPSTDAVFAGYGIVSNEPKRDDYAGVDARGKIVFAFAEAPGGAFARFNAHAKAKIAQEKGALGLVLISREANFADEKLARLDYDAALGQTAVPTAIASRKVGMMMLGASDEAGLRAAENSLAQTGNVAPPPRPVKIQLHVDLSPNKSAEAYNVVGVLEGTDPVLKSEAIVIGAHYDHLGRGGAGSLMPNSRAIHYGADDNASGVAALLELARRFAQSKNNRRTIIFVAFGGEEEGLLGSKFYVDNPPFPLARTVAMLNMDMIGRLKDNKLTVGGIGTATEWKKLVEDANPKKMTGFYDTQRIPDTSMTSVSAGTLLVPIFSLQLNEDGFGPSDHSSFYGKQIPVLFFFTGTHADYHKPSDTAEKINYAGLSQITAFVETILRAVDQNQAKPTYAVAKSSGMGTGRTGFNVSLGTIPSYSESSDGLLLDGVRENSPAAKAGVRAGDKIVRLAGRDVRNVSDYTVILGDLKASTEYEIVVVRGGERLTLKIVPAARN